MSKLEPRRPKQSSIRRSVSDAYYSVFHLLVEEGGQLLFSGATVKKDVRDLASRSFGHGQMKEVFTNIARQNRNIQNHKFNKYFPGPIPFEIREIAIIFIELQKARHDADYNTAVNHKRNRALDAIEKAEFVFSHWNSLKVNNQAAATNLVGLLLFPERNK
ncbi:MAG: hypothetical protein V4543_11185 [Bacteroidota bacterium]